MLFPLALGIVTKDDADASLNIEQLIAPSESAYSKIDINSDNLNKTDDDISKVRSTSALPFPEMKMKTAGSSYFQQQNFLTAVSTNPLPEQTTICL